MSAIYKRDESKIFSRINVLRENMLDAVPSLSSERAVLATEFYKNNEGMPPKLLKSSSSGISSCKERSTDS